VLAPVRLSRDRQPLGLQRAVEFTDETYPLHDFSQYSFGFYRPESARGQSNREQAAGGSPACTLYTLPISISLLTGPRRHFILCW